MDPRDVEQKTRTEDPGSDVEKFIAILDRIEAMKKLCMKNEVSEERSNADRKKIIGSSVSAWLPSFEWEDFCVPDNKSASITAKNDNGNGGIKIQEERRGIQLEVQGIDGRSKRPRDPEDSVASFPADHRRLRKRHSPELNAEPFHKRVTSFDLNTDDQEESELAFTVGLPAFS